MASHDQVIPALSAYGLDVVPGYVPGDESWRLRWRQWRDAIFALRDDLSELCESDPEARKIELVNCAEDPAYWVTMYGWIDEPRPVPGEDIIKPFVPFAQQIELMRWQQAMLHKPKADGYISKSRGWGASWIFCVMATHHWLFAPQGGRVHLISRKEDLVDKPLNLDSLYGKIDFLLDHLPAWMLPPGFNRDDHRLKMMLKNPATGAQLSGESTTSKSLRGARSTWIFYDEAAFIPNFMEVFGTGAGTSNHRFAVSSESFEEGHDWFDMWTNSKKLDPESVQELEYFHNPYFDPQWYEEEFARWEKANNVSGFRREYERNPYDSDIWLYPTVRDLPNTDLHYDPALMLGIAIDPGLRDPTAIAFGQPILIAGQEGTHWIDGYERAGMPPEWFAHLVTGFDPEPGDKAYPYFERSGGWSRTEQHLVDWLRPIPWTTDAVRAVMDPAGNTTHVHVDMETFWTTFVRTTRELRGRWHLRDPQTYPWEPKPLVPLWKMLKGPRGTYKYRRETALAYLPQWIFSTTDGGQVVKQRLSSARFNEPGDKATTESKPVHDDASHMTSAVEFFEVYRSTGFMEPPKKTKAKDGPSIRRAA